LEVLAFLIAMAQGDWESRESCVGDWEYGWMGAGPYMGCQNAFDLKLVSLASSSQVGFDFPCFLFRGLETFQNNQSEGRLGSGRRGGQEIYCRLSMFSVRLSGFERTPLAGKVTIIWWL
jgi:hypothetical protein